MSHKLLKEQHLPKQIYLYSQDAPAFYRFLSQLPTELQCKLVTKLGELKYRLNGSLHEPYFKFFTDRRYKGLIELRIKSKALVRVIFMQKGNDYIILSYFIKQCPRDTVTALERADRVRKKLDKTPHALTTLVPGESYDNPHS